MSDSRERARPGISKHYEDCILQTPHNEARFWRNVVVVEDCWEWVGDSIRGGYGRIALNQKLGRGAMAHRLSYRWFVGPILGDNTLDHLCRNKRCVKPAHLEQVSMKVNQLRSTSPVAVNARKTHCLNGHALAGSNLVLRPRDGGFRRHCRICINTHQNALRARNRLARVDAEGK